MLIYHHSTRYGSNLKRKRKNMGANERVKQGEYYTVDGQRWKAEEPIRDKNGEIVKWKLGRMITCRRRFNDRTKVEIFRTETQILEQDAGGKVIFLARELMDSSAGHRIAHGVMNRRSGRG